MDTSLPFFSLPFVDSESTDLDYNKSKGPECTYDDLNVGLASHGALLSADDGLLAQILAGDEPLEEPDLNGPTTLFCEICKKQFDNAKKYYGHLRVHSKDNLWICDKCPDQKFSTKQQLMKHSLTHKPLERVWKCLQCSMAFETLWRLQQHLFAKHLSYRPHKCDHCNKIFHKSSDLKKHKDTHTDIKRHPCTHCDMKFKDKSNLKRHMLRHNNEKPFCCPGCGNRFKQLASMRRHTVSCALNKTTAESTDKSARKNYCRTCGQTFKYKSQLLEHGVREHTNNPVETSKEDKTQSNTDANRIVDNIVDDILSAEDDYMTMSTRNEILNVYNQDLDPSEDNLMQIELFKEMSQLHILDGELFYDVDFDTLQPNHIFNNDDIDYCNARNEALFDFADGRNLDQDIMNSLYHAKAEHLPDELLNAPDVVNEKNEHKNLPVAVNECATIFESDVDLEASTNLAANLNQLIGENNVQYISTEDDDTFIISLNSEIDAEQLTDMLNIGVQAVKEEDNNVCKVDNYVASTAEPIIVKVEEPKNVIKNKADDKENKLPKSKSKKYTLFVCRTCNKVFNKKDNYKSHIVKLRGRHPRCATCSETPTISQLVDYEEFCKVRAYEKELDLHILNPENRISPQELAALLRSSTDHHMLVDVRSEQEFSMCRIEGATSWPIDSLQPAKLDRLVKDISDCVGPAIFICRRGNDSQIVAKMMLDMLDEEHRRKVKDLAGGLHAWSQNVDPNFPVY